MEKKSKAKSIYLRAAERVSKSDEFQALVQDVVHGKVSREQFWRIFEELTEAEVIAIAQAYEWEHCA